MYVRERAWYAPGDMQLAREENAAVMQSLELFTGAGGLALGIHRAGFDHLAVIEFNHDACDTLRLNTRRRDETGIAWPVIETDARMLDYARYGIDNQWC